jgi:NAD(P)-dependent dehydrogenase (short-subunit alcohol dehydrogenase family)
VPLHDLLGTRESLMKLKWTNSDIPKLNGKTALVTGASRGIGWEIARQLAAHGAEVVVAARDKNGTEQAIQQIKSVVPGAKVEAQLLDLADLKSVQQFAQEFLAKHEGLDILVNNAGVFSGPYRKTKDGFESHFGINYLGPFALTGLLLPALAVRKGSRVVTMSSLIASKGKIKFDDLNREKKYEFNDAYAQSKLANLIFGLELDRRCREAGLEVTSFAANPGAVNTKMLMGNETAWGRRPSFKERLLQGVLTTFGLPAEKGALPALYQATDPQAKSSEYVIGTMWPKSGIPSVGKIPVNAIDQTIAKQLWEVSEKLTGVHYNWRSTPKLASL